MDTTDIYTHRRLLFKCDNSISKIYTNIMRMMSQSIIDQEFKEETVKQIDIVIFQIFKYKTALLSLQKDIYLNEETQVKADQQIQRNKEYIKTLTEQVKSAEIVRRRKLQFNEVAKSVKQFDTNDQLNQKINQIQKQVQKLDSQYKMEMEAYAQKQRCLKIALSALRVLMKEGSGMGSGQSSISMNY